MISALADQYFVFWQQVRNQTIAQPFYCCRRERWASRLLRSPKTNSKSSDGNFTMQTMTWPLKMLAVASLLAFALAVLGACEEEGALEQAGEKADEVISDTKRAIQDAKD